MSGSPLTKSTGPATGRGVQKENKEVRKEKLDLSVVVKESSSKEKDCVKGAFIRVE